MKKTIGLSLVLLFSGVGLKGQDAAALEEQYKTCAKHYIPADKCTPEIYSQLKAKDNAPLDPKVVLALRGLNQVRAQLKNPESMQVRFVYVVDSRDKSHADGPVVCMEIRGQNSMGGMTSSLYAFFKWLDQKHPERESMTLLEDHNELTSIGEIHAHWFSECATIRSQKLYPGTDVTEKVNQALKEGK